ncbi:uncharacterized protein B0J16DRAFT_267670 [Fusarium flagelliforme]|uniref:uncharacterized protein n=1 Tax=Fusarium flagelliforme TaxID=2675880 RepID=UPI001E8DBDCC|nr:uncharacterized protein B0J16DRAFT_267670 [Fusarium flagelliforme]KAH7186231.1 hypothetical protein B0J16DRAFT_267670 [Fusarium flagelliforme]
MASPSENRGPELMAVMVAFFTASFVSCLLRLYVRTFIVRALKPDDWLMTLAMTTFTLYSAFSIYGITQGTGQRHHNLETAQITRAMMSFWFGYIWYSLTMVACKLSIGLFLLQVVTRQLHRWIIYITMVCSTISGALFFFISIFQCKPISFAWDKYQPGKCIDLNVAISLTVTYSITAVITDLIFAILPGFIIWKLQLKKKTKYFLIPLLAMGCLASVAVIARFPYLALFKKPDFLWNTVDVGIWSAIEQGLAITATSLATLRPLFKLAGFRLGLTSEPSFSPSSYRSTTRTARQEQGQGGLSSHDSYRLPSIKRPPVALDRSQIRLSPGSLEDGQNRIQRMTRWSALSWNFIDSDSKEELHWAGRYNVQS